MRDEWTSVDDVLAGLPRANSDAARSERVRARCHRTLSRRSDVRISPLRRAIESAVVGGFCAVYLCLLALMALHTHGKL